MPDCSFYVVHCFVAFIFCCSNVHRCEESTSSPGVSNSIGEGIIEEDEDEEAEVESNKKRMKEDDQEVLSQLLFLFILCVCEYVRKYWKEILLLCRLKRKAFSPGEWSCQRQKNTGRVGSEACLLSFSPAPFQNCFCLQVRFLLVFPSHIKGIWIHSFHGMSLRPHWFGWIEIIDVFFWTILPLTAQFHPWLVPLYRSGQAWQRPHYWTDAR